MWRLYYLVIRNIFRLPGIIRKMRLLAADDNCSEEECYQYIRYVVGLMKKTGFIHTEVYGTEHLPKEGGYVMYPNHQGKFDAYGIAGVHERPCTVVMDKAKSYYIFVTEIVELLKAKRLDKEDVRQSFSVISEVAEEVKQGRRYIIFPEGEYDEEKKNTLIDFKPGCFKTSMKSKTPIVPVTLIDSYKVFNGFRFGKVTTQVHFLNPISFDEYKGLKTQEVAALVRERIQEKIDEITQTGVVV